MDIQTEKAIAADAYSKFQQAFIKYYYHKLNQVDDKLSLNQLQSKIVEKWSSYKNNVLVKMFIVYRNLGVFHQYKKNKICTLSKKINQMQKDEKGAQVYKECEKMFQIKHFPVNLKFQFQNLQQEELKTPTKNKSFKSQLLRTSSTSQKKEYKWMTQRQISKLSPKEKTQLQIQWLEQDYKSLKKDVPDIFDLFLNLDPILPIKPQRLIFQTNPQIQKDPLKTKKIKKEVKKQK